MKRPTIPRAPYEPRNGDDGEGLLSPVNYLVTWSASPEAPCVRCGSTKRWLSTQLCVVCFPTNKTIVMRNAENRKEAERNYKRMMGVPQRNGSGSRWDDVDD